MAAPHYFLTSVILRAPHELFTGEFSSQNDKGEIAEGSEWKKKTSTKIGEGICRESDAVICFFMPSINFLKDFHAKQMRVSIWITSWESYLVQSYIQLD